MTYYFQDLNLKKGGMKGCLVVNKAYKSNQLFNLKIYKLVTNTYLLLMESPGLGVKASAGDGEYTVRVDSEVSSE